MTYNSFMFVGCGNMGGAMLDGWLAAGQPASTFTISDPYREDAPDGVTLVDKLPEKTFDAVLLGIKPHMLGDLADDIAKVIGPETVVFSVLAGTQLETLDEHFPSSAARVRVMPNLAVKIGKAPLALVESGLDEAGRKRATEFFSGIGSCEWLPDESQFDLVTALSGSGPGFVYRFIDALASGAAAQGLDEAQAQRLAVQMVEGAAALAAQSEHSPAELARRVASPGGMTQKGLDVLDENNALKSLVENCLVAARDRGAEMAKEARRKG
ncbi:pyrroline-5-carboxylate reductase [Qipengyuania atrilutea]|uniref:Pyrroline-5-carboxylate reductase n=1 Tax=Qipengyuania atrilutea TaxID=2744473 RepID=A0A850H7Q9_9SPHN|nr:pyrroline-5-carboxylate reductase [Actirhodobacter atriluteus]NVD45878.1 pyrroline-5-carboxylate reductase [Actirhodobacter atriluteus]